MQLKRNSNSYVLRCYAGFWGYCPKSDWAQASDNLLLFCRLLPEAAQNMMTFWVYRQLLCQPISSQTPKYFVSQSLLRQLQGPRLVQCQEFRRPKPPLAWRRQLWLRARYRAGQVWHIQAADVENPSISQPAPQPCMNQHITGVSDRFGQSARATLPRHRIWSRSLFRYYEPAHQDNHREDRAHIYKDFQYLRLDTSQSIQCQSRDCHTDASSCLLSTANKYDVTANHPLEFYQSFSPQLFT